ncbi:alcohol dehydrogenase catalytic domain-containing protein, partial [Xanthomonas euvesicatoria]
AYAAQAADQPLAPFVFERRAPGPNDVQIDIAYCGVCHSDLHTARNEWHNTLYPSVPGHEIVGRVTAVGNA